MGQQKNGKYNDENTPTNDPIKQDRFPKPIGDKLDSFIDIGVKVVLGASVFAVIGVVFMACRPTAGVMRKGDVKFQKQQEQRQPEIQKAITQPKNKQENTPEHTKKKLIN